jgi:hypothetical protein
MLALWQTWQSGRDSLLGYVWSYAKGAWSADDCPVYSVSSHQGSALVKLVTALPLRMVSQARRMAEGWVADLTGAAALTCELDRQRQISEELTRQLSREMSRADSSQEAILNLCERMAVMQAENSRMAAELAAVHDIVTSPVSTGGRSPLSLVPPADTWASGGHPSPRCMEAIYERFHEPADSTIVLAHPSDPGGSTPMNDPTRSADTLAGGCSPFLPVHTPPQHAARSGQTGLSIYLSCLQTVTEGIGQPLLVSPVSVSTSPSRSCLASPSIGAAQDRIESQRSDEQHVG